MQGWTIQGNQKTKSVIVERELTFAIGDTLDALSIQSHEEASSKNLYNTELFNFSDVRIFDTLNGYWAEIKLQERWYLWPEVVVKFQERNIIEWWREKKLSRIDWGLSVLQNNFRGRDEILKGSVYVGFTERFGLVYTVPYFSNKLKDGLKVQGSYATRSEVFTSVENNKMVYTEDPGVIQYKEAYIGAEYTRRIGLYHFHALRANYRQYWTSGILEDLNYLPTGRFLRYPSVNYYFKYDHRFTRNYPLSGRFFDVNIIQNGMGFSSIFVTDIKSTYRKYFAFSNRVYAAFGMFGRAVVGDKPFYLQSGLGFGNDYVRGYEPYVVLGDYTGLVKSCFKYAIFTPKSYVLPFIKKWQKFSKIHFALYGNVFVDYGYSYAPNPENSFNNKHLLGSGVGLDWVTYYDVVVRTEIAWNNIGTHQFNVSFVAPI